MEKLLTVYACYAADDHDLAISLTSRILGIDETTVRMTVEQWHQAPVPQYASALPSRNPF